MGFCFYHEDDHAILWKTVLLGTVMYRTMLSKVVLLSMGVFLTACGQSGALQLPSDSDYDHRAKYLLYSDSNAQHAAEKTQKKAVIQQQFSAPASAATD